MCWRRGYSGGGMLLLCLGLLWPTVAAGQQARPRPRPGLRNRAASQPASRVPPGVKALRDLEYAKVDGTSLRLDLYLPSSGPKPLPLVAWIHGGGWRGGNKQGCPALPFTAHGYAAASIEYRLTDVAGWPAQIHDCKAAIRWLRAHAKEYGLDPEHIGVWGGSAGGHLVAMLGTSGDVKELEGDEGNLRYSSRVQAVCDWFGPSDFPALAELLKSAGLSPNADGAVSKLLGGPIPEHLDTARQASPVTWISKDDPPFLIMHGDQDKLVPPSQSEILYRGLKKAGVDATLHVVEGAGHGQGGFNRPEVHRMVAEFFERTLKGRAASAPAENPAGR